jgi:hypothetical protein
MDADISTPTFRAASQTVVAPFNWEGEAVRRSLIGVWRWLRRHGSGLLAARAVRRLRLVETLSLGEKRFVSIVKVDGEQFLLGGSASSLTLLAKLDGRKREHVDGQEASFVEVLSHASGDARTRAAGSMAAPLEERI